MNRSGGFLQTLLIFILLVVVIVAGVWFYNARHRPTAGQQIGRAIDSIPPAVSSAAGDITDSGVYSSAAVALDNAGAAASSALAKTGAAASSAVSETSADVKAAAKKQKQQDPSASASK